MSTSIIDNDAREFGLHVRQGGWRLGLLVARSVDPSGKGGRPKTGATAPVSGRVSATKFAEISGTSKDRVMRYFDAWDKAAEDGLVPYSDELNPGDEFEFGFEAEDDDAPQWSKYYSAAKPKVAPAPAPAPTERPQPAPQPEPEPVIDIVEPTPEPNTDNVLEPSISLPVKEFEDLIGAIRSKLDGLDVQTALVEANQILDAVRGLIADLESRTAVVA